jgi:TRAP-type C4-dicarboxylate transport system substrate-binding protein
MTTILMKAGAGVFFATLFAATPVSALTSWDMPTPYGDSVFHTRNIMQFADEVREATDGALDITVHSAGSLFGHAEIKDGVRRGLAPVGEILMSRLANEDPIFGVDSIPFLASSYEDAERCGRPRAPPSRRSWRRRG